MGIMGRSRAPRPRTAFGRFFARPAVRRVALKLRIAMTGKSYSSKYYSPRPRPVARKKTMPLIRRGRY